MQEIAAMAAVPAAALPASGEPVLDFHQHTLYLGRSDEQLIAHQKFYGVTLTNLLAGDGWMLSELGGNADCAELQAKYPSQFVRFACADPIEGERFDVGGAALDGPVGDLRLRRKSRSGRNLARPEAKLRAAGLGGGRRLGAMGIGELKFHVAIDAPQMDRIYRLAEECRAPVLLHFEYRHYNLGIENLEKVLKRYPRVNFVGHAQNWWGHISADFHPGHEYPTGPVKPGGLVDRLLSDYANLYGDLSANSGLNALTRDPEFTRGFLRRHSRKLIWGSDCSCRDAKGAGSIFDYCISGRCLAALRKLVTRRQDLRRILYENGAELLRLKQA